MLTPDQILEADDIQDDEIIDVPEWGGKVQVRGLARGEINLTRRLARDKRTGVIDDTLMDARILQFGVVEPALTREQAEAIARSKGYKALERVLGAISKLSGLDKDDDEPDVADAKAVDAAAETFPG